MIEQEDKSPLGIIIIAIVIVAIIIGGLYFGFVTYNRKIKEAEETIRVELEQEYKSQLFQEYQKGYLAGIKEGESHVINEVVEKETAYYPYEFDLETVIRVSTYLGKFCFHKFAEKGEDELATAKGLFDGYICCLQEDDITTSNPKYIEALNRKTSYGGSFCTGFLTASKDIKDGKIGKNGFRQSTCKGLTYKDYEELVDYLVDALSVKEDK